LGGPQQNREIGERVEDDVGGGVEALDGLAVVVAAADDDGRRQRERCRRIASRSGAASGFRTGNVSPPITTETYGRQPSASTMRSVGASGLFVTIATPSPRPCASASDSCAPTSGSVWSTQIS
jgi:hypothetical protein